MRISPAPLLLTSLLLASTLATPALADVAPFRRPEEAAVAGLRFQQMRMYPSLIVLAGCKGRSKNCDLVKRRGLIGWRVVSVDGEGMGESSLYLADIERTFSGRPPSRKVKLVLEPSGETWASDAAKKRVEISLD